MRVPLVPAAGAHTHMALLSTKHHSWLPVQKIPWGCLLEYRQCMRDASVLLVSTTKHPPPCVPPGILHRVSTTLVHEWRIPYSGYVGMCQRMCDLAWQARPRFLSHIVLSCGRLAIAAAALMLHMLMLFLEALLSGVRWIINGVRLRYIPRTFAPTVCACSLP